ncbi:MAG: HlyD family efflux transporter periplasmic adaptor subunit [Proteobacteria bacterium]|nr:HlyD family efflux transporter periplasmic adaptor subunit [Pseudomonadota bacterium]
MPAAPAAQRLCAALGLTVALAACQEGAAPGWSGYAEGDYLYIAPALPGRIATLAVQAGQQVDQGAPLFTLDGEPERALEAQARAKLAAAQAQSANLASGRRPDEIAQLQAQLAQARSAAQLAQSNLARQRQLVAQGFISAATLDSLQSGARQAQDHVAELEAALRVARLPGRPAERAAAEAQAQAADQALRQSDWSRRQKQQEAPAAGQVADVFYRAGEYVSAGQPVLSLLPPANIKARFYVPEDQVATLAPGDAVQLACDGCGSPIAARVSRIATQAEYTPPVIYSNAQRAKLVFLVEARPEVQDAPRLRPGQPLDVRRVEVR